MIKKKAMTVCTQNSSKLTWQSWTIVTTTVDSFTAPMEAIMAYSRSAKPSPFPIRKPAEQENLF